MPQMAPMWWSTMFIMFLGSFMMFMIMTYFFKVYKIEKEEIKKLKMDKNMYWKW